MVKQGYKQTELGIIPEDWEVQSLGGIGETIIGLTYSPKNVTTHGTLVLRSSNVQNSRLSFKDNVFVNMDLPARVIVKKDDLLICVRNGSKNLIGKCALIDNKTSGSAFGAFMSVFRSNYSVILFHYFHSKIIQDQINETMGATINQLTNKDLSTFQIPLPPLPEQIAIATTLSDTDNLITSLTDLISKKKQIKIGTMQKLLKPQADWEVRKLGDMIEFSSGTAHENVIDTNGKYILVNSKFISTNGNNYKRTEKNYTPAFKNNILIVLSDVPNGKAIAKCFIVEQDNCYTVNQRIGIIKPKNVNVRYLYYVLNRHKDLLAFDDGIKQTNLRNQDINNLKLIIHHCLEEQTQIAKILTDMDEEITALDAKLAKYKLIKQGAMQELLTGRIRLV